MKEDFFLFEKEIRRIDKKLGIQFKDFVSKLLEKQSVAEVKLLVQELYVFNVKTKQINKDFFISYFDSANLVVKSSNIVILFDWTKKIRMLFEVSPDIALSYINATPKFLKYSKANYLIRWGELGFSLHKGTWQSNILVSVFFEVSSCLIEYFAIWDLENIIGIVDVLFLRSYDVALDFLRIVEDVTKKMNQERFYLPSVFRAISLNHWHILMGICEKLPDTVNKIHSKHRNIFMKIFEKLCLEKEGQIHLFLDDIGALFIRYEEEEEQRIILDFLMEISKKDCLAITDFLNNSETVIDRIGFNNLSNWVEFGIAKLDKNKEAGKAFFRLETLESKKKIDVLSSMVELEAIQSLMKFYCTALSGLDIQIRNSESLVEKSIGWEEASLPSTEGSNVYLPSVGNLFLSKTENFMWYKVLATHQVGHIEFGSFKFEMSKPSLLFKKNIRKNLLRNKKKLTSKGNIQKTDEMSVVDSQIGIFLRYFRNSQFALDIFTALEEGRIDRWVLKQYKGLYDSYKSISVNAIKNRRDIKTLPLVELMIEGIIRISLGDTTTFKVPKEYVNDAKKILKLTKVLLDFPAEVEDVAETTIRIYSILIKWPNKVFNYEDFVEVEMPDLNSESNLNEFDELDINTLGNDISENDSNFEQYESSENVDFRGEFKPEMVEILENIKNISNEDIEISQLKQQLEDVVQKTIGIENSSSVDMNIDDLVQNLLEEAKTNDQSNYLNKEDDKFNNQNTDIKTLQSNEPRTYIYPEWDFRIFDYKPDWCLVREKTVEFGDQAFFDDVLKNYRSLFSGIMKQFELVITEGVRKEKKLTDGDDIDIDEVVKMVIERKNGAPFSDQIYWRRNRIERDVAVALLLDISASTAEAIDNYTSQNVSSIKSHGTDYKSWIGEQMDHKQINYKRIIDLEKESIVLLISALEKIGDQYGIYAFSGYGRENVEYYIVKDFEESLSTVVKQRLDKLAPLHATRMGPSIRHTITKLNQIQAKTKILMLLSDGRPQDRGYSREGVQKEYAVFDTHMALVEAKKLGIIPFCLTIDKTGHDYLGQMCGDIGYEIVKNIWTLPKKLPLLYKRISI